MPGARKLASLLRFHDRGVTVATSIVNWEIVKHREARRVGLRVDLGPGVVSHAGRRVEFDGAEVELPMDAANSPPVVSVNSARPLSRLETAVIGRCAVRHAEDHAADLAELLRAFNRRRVRDRVD